MAGTPFSRPYGVDALLIGEILPWKNAVGMARHNQVDAWHRSKVERRGFLAFGVRACPDAGVAQRDGNIAGRAEPGQVTLSRGHDVHCRELAFEPRLVPNHDLRRHKANHAHLDFMGGTAVILKGPLQDRIRREKGAAIRAQHIGAHHGKGRAGKYRFKKFEPVIEFVIAKSDGVVAKARHHLHQRMRSLGRRQRLRRYVIGQRIALKKIPVVEQQRIFRFGAGQPDQRCRLGKPHRRIEFGVIIVPIHHEHVQIGRLKQADVQSGTAFLRSGLLETESRACQRHSRA